MRYFDGSKYSGTPYHSDWKYALLEYGKGMGSSGDDRRYHLKQALQILYNVPDEVTSDGVTYADIRERAALVEEIGYYL